MINLLLILFLFIIFFIVVFFIMRYILKKIVHKSYAKNHFFYRRRYLKEIPIPFDLKTIRRAKNAGQFIGVVFLTAIIAFTFFNNVTPLGLTVTYDLSQNTNGMSQLTPMNRVSQTKYYGQPVTKIINDLVYFTTDMPFTFDTATVKVYFKNASPNQTFSLGFQDQSGWHYNVVPYDAPFINSLKWTHSGNEPILYQRKQNYSTADTFLSNPPRDAIIGIFNYDNDIGNNSQIHLSNYNPQNSITTIPTPFRGSVVMYAYLDKEPFHFAVEKQDLNWYPDPDTVTVSVYKDNNLLYQTTAQDDGITNGSRKILPPTKLAVNNPSNQPPTSGIYKIVINANQDTIIKNIRTNLHKLVFQGSIFLAGNQAIYKGVIASTSATTVFTNALSLSALTYHNSGEQQIMVGDESLNLNTLQTPATIKPPDVLSKVIVPQNDVILNAFQGYFSFTPDQFFIPSKYYVMPVTSKDDVAMVDYILSNYVPSHYENGWQVNEQTFDLSTAYTTNNKLNWIIEAPRLKENNRSIIIRDIHVTLHKKGWLKF